MKRFFVVLLVLILVFSMTGCKINEDYTDNKYPTKTVVELNEDNYWKYLSVNISSSNYFAICEINGALDFALYEDVVLVFDVIYYVKGQTEEDYNSYTMLIGCNASGDASFTTSQSGVTRVSIGKWLGINESE